MHQEDPSFARPAPGASDIPTPHLYIANSHGISTDSITLAFTRFGPISAISRAGCSSTSDRLIISFADAAHASAARTAWNRRPCDALHGLVLLIDFAVPRSSIQLPKPVQPPVCFSSEDLRVPGLELILDFVSPEEEQKLLDEVDARPWQGLAKRRVQHYGYEFLYKLRNVDTTQALGDLPQFLQPVLDKLHSLPELQRSSEPTFPFDQLTVNEYPAGVGLSPHIDTHSAFQGSITSLSLAGSCIMEFRRYMNSSSSRLLDRKLLLLPRRSLLVLPDESRYAWHHYIPHRKFDVVAGQLVQRAARRVSFTFRKVRHGPCCCAFRQYCDSQADENQRSATAAEDEEEQQFDADGEVYEPVRESEEQISHVQDREQGTAEPARAKDDRQAFANFQELSEAHQEIAGGEEHQTDALTTPEIEKRFVHKVYDAIAPHFSSTRFAKWPKVAAFLDSLPPDSLVLDAGCGNGKYLGLNPNCSFIGCDISPSLISICSRRGHEVFVGDAVNLPFRTGFFDSAISIAVLHHLSTEQRRRRAISELLRVVKKGGGVLVTVWAAEQEDKILLNKWTPLDDRSVEEWVGDMTIGSAPKSAPPLRSIDEVCSEEEQQEYFVPWHLPYHRAEIAASQNAVASGFARKDDKKSAVVYNRYYHVFVKGELERLVSMLPGAVISESFFDKSNWCVVLRRP